MAKCNLVNIERKRIFILSYLSPPIFKELFHKRTLNYEHDIRHNLQFQELKVLVMGPKV